MTAAAQTQENIWLTIHSYTRIETANGTSFYRFQGETIDGSLVTCKTDERFTHLITTELAQLDSGEPTQLCCYPDPYAPDTYRISLRHYESKRTPSTPPPTPPAPNESPTLTKYVTHELPLPIYNDLRAIHLHTKHKYPRFRDLTSFLLIQQVEHLKTLYKAIQ